MSLKSPGPAVAVEEQSKGDLVEVERGHPVNVAREHGGADCSPREGPRADVEATRRRMGDEA